MVTLIATLIVRGLLDTLIAENLVYSRAVNWLRQRQYEHISASEAGPMAITDTS